MSKKNLNLFGTYLRPQRTRWRTKRADQALLDILSLKREPISYRELWQSAFMAGVDRDGFVRSLRELKRKRIVTISPQIGDSNPAVSLTPPVQSAATILRNG